MKIKNIFIGKQFENSDKLSEFLKIVNDKKIKVNIIEAGTRINIEKDLCFDILWPDSSNIILKNSINNNSLVCKLNYKNFSMLFTGDIEEIAEKEILKQYKENLEVLKATVLKVAHHGSKTSSCLELLEACNPKIALIGVGEKNNFGHPNNDVLQRLGNMRYKDL